MPYLVKNIKGEILDNFEGAASLVTIFEVKFGVEDYFDINTMIGFTQNFSKVVNVIKYPSLVNHGLKNNTNFIELEISYK